MPKPKQSRSRVAANERSLCQFQFADGRTCRMLRQTDHPSLCIFHARAERQIIESDLLGSELASSITGQYMTDTDINFVLGKLFKAVAQNRIAPRTAATLAFVGKLLLVSLRDLKNEYKFKYGFEAWQSMENKAIQLSDPPRDTITVAHSSRTNTPSVPSPSLAANPPLASNPQLTPKLQQTTGQTGGANSGA